ncbi:MAG: ABC transporter substrate-binding protein, partial [Promethearchaeota archaeon]
MLAEKVPPKKKSKKKIPKFAEVKKPLIIGGITAIIAVAGIIIGINTLSQNQDQDQDVVLIYGATALLNVIDPLDVADGSEIKIIEQFAEGLFDIDITSPNLDVIGGLAIDDTWSLDALNLTCILRQGVRFHDGTPFNATAVKWNFDRIYGLRNNLTYSVLWHLPDDRFLINETQVLDDYTVRFILNAPFVPFKNLLTSWTSFILSPTSTPKNSFININETNPVGTGPFKFDSCGWAFVESENKTLAVNVTMSANQDYWGIIPKIDKLIFLRFFSKPDLLDAMRLRKIHLITTGKLTESEVYPFSSNSSFIVHEGIPDGFIDWLYINNELINLTMRKAVCYAFNYSSIIETTIPDDRRAKSPLP